MPIAACFSLIVALGMGRIASAFPTEGVLYRQRSMLGGQAA